MYWLIDLVNNTCDIWDEYDFTHVKIPVHVHTQEIDLRKSPESNWRKGWLCFSWYCGRKLDSRPTWMQSCPRLAVWEKHLFLIVPKVIIYQNHQRLEPDNTHHRVSGQLWHIKQSLGPNQHPYILPISSTNNKLQPVLGRLRHLLQNNSTTAPHPKIIAKLHNGWLWQCL